MRSQATVFAFYFKWAVAARLRKIAVAPLKCWFVKSLTLFSVLEKGWGVLTNEFESLLEVLLDVLVRGVTGWDLLVLQARFQQTGCGLLAGDV